MNILQKAIRSMYSLTGSFNDKLLKYFKQYGATSSVLQDAEKQYLVGRLGAKYLTNQDYWKELDEQFGDGLPLEVSDILRKYGNDAHLYTFGPGVPILGPELVVSDFTIPAGGAASINSASIDIGDKLQIIAPSLAGVYAYDAPAGGWVLIGNTTVIAALSGLQNFYNSTGSPVTLTTSQFSVREILGYSNTYSGFVAGNYFDSAGTTHASVDGSVGLVLDAAGSVGAEIANPANFYNLNGSAWTTSGDTFLCNGGTGSYGYGALTIGKTYKYRAEITGGKVNLYLGSSTYVFDAEGVYEWIGRCSGNGDLAIQNTTTGAKTAKVSIKEVTGIHATQSTPGFKPTLRKGIVNLLTWSNDLTNAAWLKTNATVGAAVADPDGGMNAKKVAFVYGAGPITRLYQDYGTAVNGAKYTFPIWLRSDTPCQMLLGVQRSGPADVEQAVIDITASWQLFVFSHSGVFTGSSAVRGVLSSAVPGFSADVEVYRPGLFAGTLTAQQILAAGGIPLTTTAPASSVAGPNYLEFKASNATKLNLGAQMFQMTDDQWVIAAFSVASTGVEQFIFAPAGSGASADKACSILVNGGNAIARWTKGGVADYSITSPIIANTMYVVSARKIGNTGYLRVNGVAAGTRDLTGITLTTLTAGTIGCEVYGSSAPMTGSTYVAAGGKGAMPDADLLVLEKFVAQLSGVTL